MTGKRSNPALHGFTCMQCAAEFSADYADYQCAHCGQNLDINFDYDRIGKSWSKADLLAEPDQTLWRYLPLLPVAGKPERRDILSGLTPLVELPEAARQFGLTRLCVKDESRHPSGSLKDRATELALQQAHEQGHQTLVAASTGNTAASLATLAANRGKRAIILVPATTAAGKLTQMLQCGATVCLVDGSYDAAFDLAAELVLKHGLYPRSSGLNAVLSEGKKTVALEIAEQFNWSAPDQIFVPVGDGCIIGGVYKGFADLLALGWIDRLPQINAVQAEGSAAIVQALESGQDIVPCAGQTVADGIAVSYPRDGLKALRAVRESSGYGLQVSDGEILQAQHELAQSSGLFAEPSAAAAYAGFLKACSSERINAGESVVLISTGTGLKDIASANRLLEKPQVVAPHISAILAMLKSQGVLLA